MDGRQEVLELQDILVRLRTFHEVQSPEGCDEPLKLSPADHKVYENEVTQLLSRLLVLIHQTPAPVKADQSILLTSGARDAQISLRNLFSWLVLVLKRSERNGVNLDSVIHDALTSNVVKHNQPSSTGTKLLWCACEEFLNPNQSAQEYSAISILGSFDRIATIAMKTHQIGDAHIETSKHRTVNHRAVYLVAAFGKLFDAIVNWSERLTGTRRAQILKDPRLVSWFKQIPTNLVDIFTYAAPPGSIQQVEAQQQQYSDRSSWNEALSSGTALVHRFFSSLLGVTMERDWVLLTSYCLCDFVRLLLVNQSSVRTFLSNLSVVIIKSICPQLRVCLQQAKHNMKLGSQAPSKVEYDQHSTSNKIMFNLVNVFVEILAPIRVFAAQVLQFQLDRMASFSGGHKLVANHVDAVRYKENVAFITGVQADVATVTGEILFHAAMHSRSSHAQGGPAGKQTPSRPSRRSISGRPVTEYVLWKRAATRCFQTVNESRHWTAVLFQEPYLDERTEINSQLHSLHKSLAMIHTGIWLLDDSQAPGAPGGFSASQILGRLSLQNGVLAALSALSERALDPAGSARAGPGNPGRTSLAPPPFSKLQQDLERVIHKETATLVLRLYVQLQGAGRRSGAAAQSAPGPHRELLSPSDELERHKYSSVVDIQLNSATRSLLGRLAAVSPVLFRHSTRAMGLFGLGEEVLAGWARVFGAGIGDPDENTRAANCRLLQALVKAVASAAAPKGRADRRSELGIAKVEHALRWALELVVETWDGLFFGSLKREGSAQEPARQMQVALDDVGAQEQEPEESGVLKGPEPHPVHWFLPSGAKQQVERMHTTCLENFRQGLLPFLETDLSINPTTNLQIRKCMLDVIEDVYGVSNAFHQLWQWRGVKASFEAFRDEDLSQTKNVRGSTHSAPRLRRESVLGSIERIVHFLTNCNSLSGNAKAVNYLVLAIQMVNAMGDLWEKGNAYAMVANCCVSQWKLLGNPELSPYPGARAASLQAQELTSRALGQAANAYCMLGAHEEYNEVVKITRDVSDLFRQVGSWSWLAACATPFYHVAEHYYLVGELESASQRLLARPVFGDSQPLATTQFFVLRILRPEGAHVETHVADRLGALMGLQVVIGSLSWNSAASPPAGSAWSSVTAFLRLAPPQDQVFRHQSLRSGKVLGANCWITRVWPVEEGDAGRRTPPSRFVLAAPNGTATVGGRHPRVDATSANSPSLMGLDALKRQVGLNSQEEVEDQRRVVLETHVGQFSALTPVASVIAKASPGDMVLPARIPDWFLESEEFAAPRGTTRDPGHQNSEDKHLPESAVPPPPYSPPPMDNSAPETSVVNEEESEVLEVLPSAAVEGLSEEPLQAVRHAAVTNQVDQNTGAQTQATIESADRSVLADLVVPAPHEEAFSAEHVEKVVDEKKQTTASMQSAREVQTGPTGSPANHDAKHDTEGRDELVASWSTGTPAGAMQEPPERSTPTIETSRNTQNDSQSMTGTTDGDESTLSTNWVPPPPPGIPPGDEGVLPTVFSPPSFPPPPEDIPPDDHMIEQMRATGTRSNSNTSDSTTDEFSRRSSDSSKHFQETSGKESIVASSVDGIESGSESGVSFMHSRRNSALSQSTQNLMERRDSAISHDQYGNERKGIDPEEAGARYSRDSQQSHVRETMQDQQGSVRRDSAYSQQSVDPARRSSTHSKHSEIMPQRRGSGHSSPREVASVRSEEAEVSVMRKNPDYSQQSEAVPSRRNSGYSQQDQTVQPRRNSDYSQQSEVVPSRTNSGYSQQDQTVQSRRNSGYSQQSEAVQSRRNSGYSQQDQTVQSRRNSDYSQQSEAVPSRRNSGYSQQSEAVQSRRNSGYSQQDQTVQSRRISDYSQQSEAVPSRRNSGYSQQDQTVQSRRNSDYSQQSEAVPSRRNSNYSQQSQVHEQSRRDSEISQVSHPSLQLHPPHVAEGNTAFKGDIEQTPLPLPPDNPPPPPPPPPPLDSPSATEAHSDSTSPTVTSTTVPPTAPPVFEDLAAPHSPPPSLESRWDLPPQQHDSTSAWNGVGSIPPPAGPSPSLSSDHLDESPPAAVATDSPPSRAVLTPPSEAVREDSESRGSAPTPLSLEEIGGSPKRTFGALLSPVAEAAGEPELLELRDPSEVDGPPAPCVRASQAIANPLFPHERERGEVVELPKYSLEFPSNRGEFRSVLGGVRMSDSQRANVRGNTLSNGDVRLSGKMITDGSALDEIDVVIRNHGKPRLRIEKPGGSCIKEMALSHDITVAETATPRVMCLSDGGPVPILLFLEDPRSLIVALSDALMLLNAN